MQVELTDKEAKNEAFSKQDSVLYLHKSSGEFRSASINGVILKGLSFDEASNL
jgi:hypothetical protein